MEIPHLWVDNCALLLRALNEKDVEYLLIGSMAKSDYRTQPHVNDMDPMINCTPENKRKVLSVLVDLDYQFTDDPEKLTKRGKRFLLFDGSVDVLTPPEQSFSLDEAVFRSTQVVVFGIPVPVASMCDLEALDSLREPSA